MDVSRGRHCLRWWRCRFAPRSSHSSAWTPQHRVSLARLRGLAQQGGLGLNLLLGRCEFRVVSVGASGGVSVVAVVMGGQRALREVRRRPHGCLIHRLHGAAHRGPTPGQPATLALAVGPVAGEGAGGIPRARAVRHAACPSGVVAVLVGAYTVLPSTHILRGSSRALVGVEAGLAHRGAVGGGGRQGCHLVLLPPRGCGPVDVRVLPLPTRNHPPHAHSQHQYRQQQ